MGTKEMKMRKILIAALAATALLPSTVSAQSAHEVRHDEREVARDQAKTRQAAARGNFHKADRQARETREDQRELRHDWRDYRQKNRNAFRRGSYVAPRGMTYRRVAVGVNLNRAFWGSRYRIPNYQSYRLPWPGYHRAYVRYGNDVLLISLRDGHVIEVFPDFFW
jgi:Ni/Co efflux regulator RcnB